MPSDLSREGQGEDYMNKDVFSSPPSGSFYKPVPDNFPKGEGILNPPLVS